MGRPDSPPGPMMLTRLRGIAYFLPVPIVLWLFTQAPLGVRRSIALGLVMVVTHRLYARPFALRFAGERCLWSGATIAEGPVVEIREPGGVSTWRCRSEREEDRLRRLLSYASRNRALIRVGIVGVLAIFVAGSLFIDRGLLGPLVREDAVAFFRGGIALVVLPLSIQGPRARRDDDQALASPFPVHIQALIGSAAVLWLFRIVGAVWLALAALHVAARFGQG